MEQIIETHNQAAIFVVSISLVRPFFLWNVLAQFPCDAHIFPAAHGHGMTFDREQIGDMFTSEMVEQNTKLVIFAVRDSSSNKRTCSGRDCRRHRLKKAGSYYRFSSRRERTYRI